MAGFEVSCPWAELVIEAEAPLLMHGSVTDVLTNAERLLTPLQKAGVAYRVECYSDEGKLLQEFKWGNPDLNASGADQ